MLFEWDELKARTNLDKHGVRFEDAVRIFDGPVVTIDDDRFEYAEARSISVGVVGVMTFLVVVHVDRDEVTRIISARRATPKERRFYDAKIQKG